MSEYRTFGGVLRAYRAAANLTQEELAERSDVSAQAISALERGVRRAPRPSTVESLATALRLGPAQRRALVEAARGLTESGGPPASSPEPQALLESIPTDVLVDRGPLPAGSRMPLAPNPLFVGRGDELLQIAAVLRGGDTTVALGQVVASTGLGGLGKTQLAVELVHRYGRFFAGGVFWLSFASADDIPLQVAACAGSAFETRPLDERVQRVKDAWQSAVPRLLVFDNCEEETLLDAWRPASGGCRVLVTSRRSHWAPPLGVTALPLDVLPRADSVELLRRYRPDLPAGDPGLDAIADELGDLPLALHLGGSYLRSYSAELSLPGYLAELRQSELVRHASLLGAGLGDSVSPTHHLHGVAQTFALCLGRLDRAREVDRVAIAALARMACMAPGEPVPRDLLARTMADVEPLLRADGLRRLGAVGLVEEGEGWLRLHRLLVHFVRQESLDPTAQPAVDRALIECGKAAGERHLSGPALEALLPHLVDVASRQADDRRRLAALRHAAGLALRHAGDPAAARPWLERALAIREEERESDHLDTAATLIELASLLWAEYDLAAAWTFAERALAIHDGVLGSDLHDAADAGDDPTRPRVDYGDLAAVKLLFERATVIREGVLGPDRPWTAPTFNELAVLLREGAGLDAGKPLLERALAIWVNVHGGDTARSLYDLGRLLQTCGELTAARPLYERALTMWELELGSDHPSIALSLYFLSRLLREQGDLAAARPLVERALGIRERVLGPNHQETAASLHDLATLLAGQGDRTAARPLLDRALAIREHVLGRDHPDTVATRRALEELAG
jgi:transcriptional regulator with XRE-family HTH domain/tetratricopeptide (TPR) repeat protein